MVVGASPQRTWDVLTDFEGYPTWAADLKSAEVVERDDEGRALDVAFRAAAMGRSTSYTLRYDYEPGARRAGLEAGPGRHHPQARRLLRARAGRRRCRPHRVTYHLEVDLLVPLPGFVKRRAEARIMTTALR